MFFCFNNVFWFFTHIDCIDCILLTYYPKFTSRKSIHLPISFLVPIIIIYFINSYIYFYIHIINYRHALANYKFKTRRLEC